MPREAFVPVICIVSAVLSYWLRAESVRLFGGYQMGFETLLVNALLTFSGLYIYSHAALPSESTRAVDQQVASRVAQMIR